MHPSKGWFTHRGRSHAPGLHRLTDARGNSRSTLSQRRERSALSLHRTRASSRQSAREDAASRVPSERRMSRSSARSASVPRAALPRPPRPFPKVSFSWLSGYFQIKRLFSSLAARPSAEAMLLISVVVCPWCGRTELARTGVDSGCSFTARSSLRACSGVWPLRDLCSVQLSCRVDVPSA